MNKLIPTVILATFTAVCSFGAAAADYSDKDKGSSSGSYEKRDNKTGRDKPAQEMRSTSDVTGHAKTPDTERTDEYRDQEVMNKKPYKQKQ